MGPTVSDGAFPRTRGACANGQRPCPWTTCRHHLLAEARGRRLEDLAETCALDVADRGGATLEEVGSIMNLTRERIRQIETRAMKRLGDVALLQEFRSENGQRRPPRRRRVNGSVSPSTPAATPPSR